MIKTFSLLFSFLLVITLTAQEIKFYGQAKQGGIIIGEGKNIKSAVLNNSKLQVDSNGVFVFGFDRDAKGKFELKVKFNNRKTKTFYYVVKKQKYNIERLRVSKSFTNPPKSVLERINKESDLMKEARANVGKIKKALFFSGFTFPLDSIDLKAQFGIQRILNGKPSNIHNGLDFAGQDGDSIKAIADGIVQIAGENFFYNGTFILLDHGQGLTSVYLHMSKLLVTTDQKVKKGEVIGLVGSSGRATGPHLHLGVQWYKKRIDPMSLLELKF